jgi:hypothetical protein
MAGQRRYSVNSGCFIHEWIRGTKPNSHSYLAVRCNDFRKVTVQPFNPWGRACRVQRFLRVCTSVATSFEISSYLDSRCFKLSNCQRSSSATSSRWSLTADAAATCVLIRENRAHARTGGPSQCQQETQRASDPKDESARPNVLSLANLSDAVHHDASENDKRRARDSKTGFPEVLAPARFAALSQLHAAI